MRSSTVRKELNVCIDTSKIITITESLNGMNRFPPILMKIKSKKIQAVQTTRDWKKYHLAL